jgi:hypothetical protein
MTSIVKILASGYMLRAFDLFAQTLVSLMFAQAGMSGHV